MTNFKIILIISLFISSTYNVFGQLEIDSVGLTHEQLKTVKEFSNYLKNGNVNKSLAYISNDFIRSIDQNDLLTILNTISARYNKQEKIIVTAIKGIPFRNIGTFGHDVNGTYEIKVMYDFYNKQNHNYCSYNIYFTDSEPLTKIKYLEIYDNKKVLVIDNVIVPDIPRTH